MHEVAQAIGWLSAVVLIVAVGAWLKLLFRPALQRLDGRPPANGGRFEAASQLYRACGRLELSGRNSCDCRVVHSLA